MLIAIDVSGSTSFKTRDDFTIFQKELAVAKRIEEYFSSTTPSQSKYIGWSEEAKTYETLEAIELVGKGTEPQCLYENSCFQENMNTSHIVLFTDGAIESSDISVFYERMSQENCNAVFTFCIVSGTKTKVADVNVSVAFPIISLARKAIFMYYDPYTCEGDRPRVLYTIGYSELNNGVIPEITEKSKWSDFPYLTDIPSSSFEQEFDNHHSVIPHGIIRIDGQDYDDICYDEIFGEDLGEDLATLGTKIMKFENQNAYILATFIYKCKNNLNVLKKVIVKARDAAITDRNSSVDYSFYTKWIEHIEKLMSNRIGFTSRIFSCSR